MVREPSSQKPHGPQKKKKSKKNICIVYRILYFLNVVFFEQLLTAIYFLHYSLECFFCIVYHSNVLPFDACLLSCSVLSDSLWSHGLFATKLSYPWNFFKARIVHSVGISCSRGSFQPRHCIPLCRVFCIGRQLVYQWVTSLVLYVLYHLNMYKYA